MGVQRQTFFLTVTRDQIMTDLQVMGITGDMLIGIGESGSGEWETYSSPWAHGTAFVRAEGLSIRRKIPPRALPSGTPDLGYPSPLVTP